MLEERLLDTKKSLQKLATQSGQSLEDILKFLTEHTLEPNQSSITYRSTVHHQISQQSNYIQTKKTVDHSFKGQINAEGDEKSHDELSKILERTLESIEQSVIDLNKSTTMILDNVVEQMVTKKVYKIRQNFRQLVSRIVDAEELSFYFIHESGRIEYQDFCSNFITEILQSDQKYEKIEKFLGSISDSFTFIDFTNNFDLQQLFGLKGILSENQYFGVIQKNVSSEEQSNFSYCLMVKPKKQNDPDISKILTSKLLTKVLQISQISTSEDSFSAISKIYTKKMLDLLQILIIQYDSRLKETLFRIIKSKKENYNSLSTIIKIILSKVDENLGNEQIISMIKRLADRFQEMQYKKVEEIRMYQKYLRDDNLVLLQFNRVGVLEFISGNRDNQYLNDLSKVWQKGKPVMDILFGKNLKFQQILRKVIKGSSKAERPVQITNSIKIKINTNAKKIQKIYIIMEAKQKSSHSISLSLQKGEQTNLKQIVFKQTNMNERTNRLQTLRQLEKENPGILKQGWLDLFVKSNERRSSIQGSMAKKCYTYVPILENKRSMKKKSTFNCQKLNLDHIQIDNANINILGFNQRELEGFVIKLFESLDYFQRIPQERQKLLNFVSDIHEKYQTHNNPFHNFYHGVNVMHTAYLLSSMPANFSILTVKDIFVNVFSGLCHDVGHTGFTNAFEVASMSQKALIYNDRSPLENFHASLAFEILRKEQNNFLCNMDRDQFSKFRKAVIQNILYTDIKEHFPLLNSFNDLLKSGKTLGREDAPILSYMIIHSSDFGGSIKSFQVCKQWSRRVNKQFMNQYKIEGQLGLTQTPFMKDLANPLVLSKAEGGFLKIIVYPLYQALDSFYVSESLTHKLRKNIEQNIKGWQQIHKAENQKQKELTQINEKTENIT